MSRPSWSHRLGELVASPATAIRERLSVRTVTTVLAGQLVRATAHLHQKAEAFAIQLTEHFPSSVHRRRLFDEQPGRLLRVSRFQRQADGPLVSDPERAVLELLSDVGVREPLQEARDLLEGAPSLRAAALQELLGRCKQVKTVRLCLTLGREMGLPWAAKLDPKGLPTGSRQRWVGHSKEGLLVLKACNVPPSGRVARESRVRNRRR